MFDSLKGFAPSTVPETQTTVVVPSTPAAPPTRFGAVRYRLAPDPESPVITISERKNENNHNDYVVHINKFISFGSTYYAELLTLLRTIKKPTQVHIFISSPGGSLGTGAMIASAIKNCEAEVTTIAIGVIASAAALIWSYGHRKVAIDGSVVMFHMSSHGDYGNSTEVAITAMNAVRYVKEVAIDPLVAEGLLTAEEAETIIDRRQDLWLDSTQINERLERISHGQDA